MSCLQCVPSHSEHDNQARDNHAARDQADKKDAPSTSRKLAPDDIVLALQVSVESDGKDEQGDAEERGPERLACGLETG